MWSRLVAASIFLCIGAFIGWITLNFVMGCGEVQGGVCIWPLEQPDHLKGV